MRLPDDSQRHVVIGRTGEGKTQAAINALSFRSWDVMPWYVMDFKDDELINDIPGAIHLDGVEVPKEEAPGLYIAHPSPDDFEGMEKLFEHIWRSQRRGLFVDEAYMISRPGWHSTWFRRLLTQGRSRRCPVILCAQRSSWLDRFMFSEASFFQIFKLSNEKDQKAVREYIDGDVDTRRLERYWSYYYDVAESQLMRLRPCPDRDTILARFAERMEEMRESAPPMHVRPAATFL
jgi:hypothetical protein